MIKRLSFQFVATTATLAYFKYIEMRTILLTTVLLFMQVGIIRGQAESRGIFLTGKNTQFYVELREHYATVFNFGRWIDKAGWGYSGLKTDTMRRLGDTSPFLFEGRFNNIQKVDTRLYLITRQGSPGKEKRIEIDTVSNTALANSALNNAYWSDNFFKLCNEINSTFDLYHYSFRDGFHMWESFDNKDAYHKEFRVFADNKIKKLKDSITTLQTPYVLLTNEVTKNISTVEYASLKETISKLLADSLSRSQYFSVVVKSICLNRPELFFRLAEDMPEQKSMLFGVVYGKETFKKLKAVETNSVTKKELFKERRKNRTFTIKAIATAVAGAVLLASSLYFLLK